MTLLLDPLSVSHPSLARLGRPVFFSLSLSPHIYLVFFIFVSYLPFYCLFSFTFFSYSFFVYPLFFRISFLSVLSLLSCFCLSSFQYLSSAPFPLFVLLSLSPLNLLYLSSPSIGPVLLDFSLISSLLPFPSPLP